MYLERFYLSTMDENAHIIAEKYGLGLEIAEFCTAWNMDEKFAETDEAVREKIRRCARKTLHAPFNELFPCAIDPKAAQLARDRYRQAIALAKVYGAAKVVIHGGYNPRIYYPQWYVERSVDFWADFLKEDPGVEIVLENVLEEDPDDLAKIVSRVDHPRLGLCLDVGHVNAYSAADCIRWMERWAPHLRHFHLHNNDGTWDSHKGLNDGTLPMATLLKQAEMICPRATFTLELTDSEPSVRWLMENVP